MGSPVIFKGKLAKFLAKAGILVPTRSTIDRSGTPEQGETAFNTTDSKLEVYDGTEWVQLGAGGATGSVEVKEEQASEGDPLVFFKNDTNASKVRSVSDSSETSLFYYGDFTSYAKKSKIKLLNSAELNSTTADLAGFKLKPTNRTVRASIVVGNSLFIGGDFTSYGNAYAGRIAKIDLVTGELDATFNSGEGFDGGVYDFAVDSSGRLYVVGDFFYYNGTYTTSLVRIDATTGALDTAWSLFTNTGVNNSVECILIDDSDNIYIGGNFTSYTNSIGTTSVSRIIKIGTDPAATVDPTFNSGSGFDSRVYTIALDGVGNLYVGGIFSSYNGSFTPKVAKLDATTGARDTTFNTGLGGGPSSTVYKLVIDGGSLFIAGSFSSFNNFNLQSLVKIDKNSAQLDGSFSLTNGFDNNPVNDIKLDGLGNIFCSGSFTTFTNLPAQRLIKLNTTNGARDNTFDTSTGFSSGVYRIVLHGSSVFAFGEFINYKNTNEIISAKAIMKVSVLGLTPDLSFNPGSGFIGPFNSTATVEKVIYDGVKLTAVGYFSLYNGDSVSNIVQIDPNTGLRYSTWPSSGGFSGTVRDICKDSITDDFYCVGSMTSYNGVTTNKIAKISGNGTLDTTFNTNIGSGFTSGTPYCIVESDGSLFAGGDFTAFQSVTARRVIKLSVNGVRDNAFVSNSSTTGAPSGTVYGLIPDGVTGLYVYGTFSTYNNSIVGAHVKVSQSTNATDNTFDNTTLTYLNSYSLADIFDAVSDGASLYVTGIFDKHNATSANGLAKISLTDGSLISAFNTEVGFDPIDSMSNGSVFQTVLPISNKLILNSRLQVPYKSNYLSSSLVLNATTAAIDQSVQPISFTLSVGDNNKTYFINGTLASSITVPASLPVGFRCRLVQIGSADVNILPVAGVTLNNSGGSTSTSVQYTGAELISYQSDTYLLTIT